MQSSRMGGPQGKAPATASPARVPAPVCAVPPYPHAPPTSIATISHGAPDAHIRSSDAHIHFPVNKLESLQ